MVKKEEIRKFLRSTFKKFESTPYAPYLEEAIYEVKDIELLYKILKNPNIVENARRKAQKKLETGLWDKPRILSILNLKNRQEYEYSGFDYETEIKKTFRFLLRENPGVLNESSKHLYHKIRSEPIEYALDIIIDSMKECEEKIRVQKLKDLSQFPNDEFLIAKYISADVDDKIVAKVWDRDPKKDMSFSQELFCCTLPRFGPDYLVDPNISMIDFFGDGERYARAILVACKENDGNKCLMVDSIEGNSELVDNHHKHEDLIRNFISGNIIKYAGECGFDSIFFNSNCWKQYLISDSIKELPSTSLFLKPIFRVRQTDMKDDYYIESFRSKDIKGFKRFLIPFFTRKYKVNGRKLNVSEYF